MFNRSHIHQRTQALYDTHLQRHATSPSALKNEREGQLTEDDSGSFDSTQDMLRGRVFLGLQR